MLRLIVASETSTPLSSKKASQCSDKVRSGLDSKCPGNHSLKASPFTEGVPGILRISTSPVRRLLLSQRLIDGGHRDPEELCDLLPRDAVLGMPWSIAASVFNLRSLEYAFMDPIFVQVHYLRNPL